MDDFHGTDIFGSPIYLVVGTNGVAMLARRNDDGTDQIISIAADSVPRLAAALGAIKQNE
jgi:hypothetical protein